MEWVKDISEGEYLFIPKCKKEMNIMPAISASFNNLKMTHENVDP